ncbi:MAG: hypothetical protein JWL59_1047 [Chthoniobacteraceae bacterium]|nr:hypothetical protein [Chthoniobacteraceae bacterium]
MAELEERKKTLIHELDRARAELSAHSRGARAHAHPAVKLRAAFAKNRLIWISGAAVLGLVLAKIPARTKKVVVNRKNEKQMANAGKAGLALGALKMAFDLGKPFIMSWATGRLGDLAKRSNQRHERRY